MLLIVQMIGNQNKKSKIIIISVLKVVIMIQYINMNIMENVFKLALMGF